ncbi:cytochrome c [Flavihumibacter rivuli]|uniref:c-type cytochrome n=1 Tax=Flavihumibacter rivuli TaxID=2838156 RepID=UPI001BDEB964|nr:cytochrome c [Flavihumibacter rivuli]ULQ57843.1 cytochrome c [Flavihumibacter rivuli]
MKIIRTLFVAVLAIAVWTAQSQADPKTQSIKRGKEVYANNCQSCHLENGEGVEGLNPPLAKSDYLMKNPKKAVDIILRGQNEEIMVNGKKYSVMMPEQSYLSDTEIADVVNYISNSWGNKWKSAIKPEEVKERRKHTVE